MVGYRGDSRYSSDYEPHEDSYDSETTPQYAEYSGLDEDFEYRSPGSNENWKWVASIAAAVLTIAVIATAVVLSGGDDKPPAAAITTPLPSLTPVTTAPPPPPSASVEPSTTTVTTTPALETPSTVPSTEAPPPEPPPSNPMLPPEGQRPITPAAFVYYVTGNQTPGDLLTITYTDGNGATRTVLGASLPWTMIVNPSPGIVGGSITATSFASQINCSISNSENQMLAVQSNNNIIARCAK
ncbi:MAG: MmpS family transport accessory protein [Mycobacterium sp.]